MLWWVLGCDDGGWIRLQQCLRLLCLQLFGTVIRRRQAVSFCFYMCNQVTLLLLLLRRGVGIFAIGAEERGCWRGQGRGQGSDHWHWRDRVKGRSSLNGKACRVGRDHRDGNDSYGNRWWEGRGRDWRVVLVLAVRPEPHVFCPGHMVELDSLDNRSGELLLSLTGQQGLLSLLLLLCRTKEQKMLCTKKKKPFCYLRIISNFS